MGTRKARLRWARRKAGEECMTTHGLRNSTARSTECSRAHARAGMALAAAGGGVCSGLSCWLPSSDMVLGIGLGGRSPVEAHSSSESCTGTTAPVEGAVGAGRGYAVAGQRRGPEGGPASGWSVGRALPPALSPRRPEEGLLGALPGCSRWGLPVAGKPSQGRLECGAAG